MRLTSLGAFGIGFVLGSRAGKERYDQIKDAARRSAEKLESYGAGGSIARRTDEAHRSSDSGPAT